MLTIDCILGIVLAQCVTEVPIEVSYTYYPFQQGAKEPGAYLPLSPDIPARVEVEHVNINYPMPDASGNILIMGLGIKPISNITISMLPFLSDDQIRALEAEILDSNH